MDEIFGEIIGCGFGSDSIMLKLLRSAMNKAHENVESTDGSIELLSARSKFYELAMILVEGCSQLIEEKAEIPESNREKMLADLMESRDMVMGRIKELRIGMFEKDRELMESLANEWKLRQKLELKERELVSLREKFEFERRKSDGFDEGKEEECDIRELKNSVDQQVWSIKQKLEDERISLASGNEFLLGSDHQMFELKLQERELFMRPEQKIVIDQMSSDIDGLKGTLDLAFGRMQNAETRPLEDQWGWKVEKDTMLILIEGFMGDLKEKFQVELEKSAKKEVASGWLNENWGILIEDITCLRQELGDLCYSNETESKKVVQSHESLVPARKISRASSEPLSQSSLAEDPRDEDKDGDGSHVAKMIKSHESIIRKQREELNRLKREMILREKEESLSSKRLKDSNNLERRIQEVVARLDNVIKWKGKIQEERGKFSDAETFAEKFGCRRQTSLNDEIRMLKQEGDDSNLEIMMMEETYVVLFKGLLEDFYLNLENYETASTTRDDIFTFLLKEIAKDWKKKMDFDSSGNTIKEERNQLPICKSFSRKHQEVRNPLNSLEKFVESKLKEDVYTVFIREMIMEFDAFKCENLIKEEIHSFLIIEAAKDSYMFSRESDKSSEVCGEENLIQTLDCLLKCVEVEEDLMLKASCEIKEHNTNNDLVATECEEVDERDAIEWLLTEEESTFCSVSNKLEKALQQLFISKELLRELQVGLGIISVGNMGKVYERENSFGLPKDNQIGELGLSNSVFSPLIGLQKMLVDFESMAQQKLGMNLLRLKELKQQMHPLAQPMASLKKTKLLYKKAFSRRCHNLKLAETEVDLLGDQVDVLVGLLEKIYLIMDQHSPVLSPHFQVYDILKLIKKEIRGVAAQQPL